MIRALCAVALLVASPRADACDRATSPLEQATVGLASADLVVVADVTRVENRVATLSIVNVLKGSANAGEAISVRGVVDEALHERCSGTSIAARRRYLFALWKPTGTSKAYSLVHAHTGVVAHTGAVERQWRDAIAKLQPISAWRAQPSGLAAQLVVDPDPPTPGDVDLVVLVRNMKDVPVKLDLKSWPRNAMFHCKLDITNTATKQKIAAKPVPIPAADIAKYFARNPRAHQIQLAPGDAWVVRLDRVTTATPGWGYKEDLGFVFYPVARAGDHRIAATCWNFVRRNSKLETGAITVPLSP